MVNAKSVYLSGDVVQQIEDIKPLFNDIKIEPTDSMIISAALQVYKEYLEKDKTDTIPQFTPGAS